MESGFLPLRRVLLHVRFGLAALVFGLAARPAYAQEVPLEAPRRAEIAHARALFDEGLALLDRARWADAEDRFRRCLAIRRSPVVAYNLASVLEAQGELVEASLLLRAIVEGVEASAIVRRASAERLRRIEPRLAYLTVALTGTSRDASVWIDGRRVPDEGIGGRLPLEPGRHEVVARDRRAEASVQIDAEAGASLDLSLALRARSHPSGPDISAGLEAADDGVERQERRKRRWLWSTLSTAVAGSVAATLLAVTR